MLRLYTLGTNGLLTWFEEFDEQLSFVYDFLPDR